MIALIITQSPGAARRALRRLAEGADLILAADGGARLAHAAGIIPHLIIGDQDSLDRTTARWADRRGIARLTFPREKDATDAELALHEAVRRGARDVWVYSVISGRLDQMLANLLLLFEARRLAVRARLTDGRTRAWLVNRTARVDGRPGDTVSLVPLSSVVRGLVTTGLRYPLRHGVLRRGSTRGISNEMTHAHASVRVSSGDLLLIHVPQRARAADRDARPGR